MASYRFRYCVVAVLILVATETALVVGAEEPITPIGMLLVNPSAFHPERLSSQTAQSRRDCQGGPAVF